MKTKAFLILILKNRFAICCLQFVICISWLTANCILPVVSFSQGTWTKKANFSGTARQEAVGFSIGGKGYICGGRNASWIYQTGFWEYDPILDMWTQKADTPAVFRSSAVAFSIGGKGYICTGAAAVWPKDMWEYDPTLNIWTKKADFPGSTRWGSIAFTIGNKGYVGMGWDLSVNNTDLWEYDPGTDTWAKKANKPGVGVTEAVGFSVGNKGYVALGLNGGTSLWEYDPSNNSWTGKANFPGSATQALVGFSIGTKGYIGTGCCYKKDFWEYNPSNNSWTKMPDFGGAARGWAVGFSIGCKGYIGTGYDPASQQDFWEYCPDTVCCNNTLSATISLQNIPCNGQCTGAATVTPTGGASPYTYIWSNSPTTQIITGLCAGTYTVTVTDGAGSATTATVTITQPTLLTATITSTSAACGSNNGTANVTAGGGTPGYSYNWNPTGQTSQTATGLGTGTYTATVTDANNCTTSQTIAVVSSGGSINTSQSASICSGSTYTLPGGTIVNTGGAYIDTLSAGGCDSIITTTLTVNSNPTANIYSNVTIIQGQSVTLTASGGGTYLWSPATGLNCTTCATVTASPLWGAGGLIYCVTITNANNCTDTACVTVTIEPIDCFNAGELYLPNAFSPNNDGENDKLQIYYGNILCIKTFKLVIYNRWGEKIYETTNPIAQWDGTYKGKLENTAVFVYYMKATLISGEEIIKKSNLSLMR